MGFRASQVQPGSAKHVDLLGVHGTRDPRRRPSLQLWPVHARKRYAPLQDAVGRTRRAAVVVLLRRDQYYSNAVTSRPGFQLGSPRMAAAAGSRCNDPWTIDRALHTMSWRYQPPALSPVSPAGLLAGFAAIVGRRGDSHQLITDELKRRYQAADVMLTDSGTSALVIALQSLVPRGGTVAYPAYGCIDLTAAAVRARVKVRLYDLDPLTLSPDMDSLRETMERGVDAILVAHLYGYPADVIAVNA